MKTKQQFFEWVGITPETFYSAHASYTETENRCRNESPEMLWALVKHTYSMEFIPIKDLDDTLYRYSVTLIQNATGKKWSEISEWIEAPE